MWRQCWQELWPGLS